MRVSFPITDVIHRTTISTKGDLVVRGTDVPEALSAGADGTFFRGKGAGVIPAYEVLGGTLKEYLKAQGAAVNPAFSALRLDDVGVKIGYAEYATSGLQAITGVGYTPSVVLFLARNFLGVTQLDTSFGWDNGSESYCLQRLLQDTRQSIINGRCIAIEHDGDNWLLANINSMDADGFTLDWLEDGTMSVGFTYLCLP